MTVVTLAQDWLASVDWPTFLAAALGGGAVWKLLDHRRGTRDLAMRSEVETTKVFLTVSARAQGGLEGDPTARISHGERLAALRLLGRLTRKQKWLRQAGLDQLEAVVGQAYDDAYHADELMTHLRQQKVSQEVNGARCRQDVEELHEKIKAAEDAVIEAFIVLNLAVDVRAERDLRWYLRWREETFPGQPMRLRDTILGMNTRRNEYGNIVMKPVIEALSDHAKREAGKQESA